MTARGLALVTMSLDAARRGEPAYVVRGLQAAGADQYRVAFPDQYRSMWRTINTFDGLVRMEVGRAWREHRASVPWYRRWKLGYNPDQQFTMNLYRTWQTRLEQLLKGADNS